MKTLYLYFLLAISLVLADSQIPKLTRFATDFTATLSQEQTEQLSYDLGKFADSTSNQILVLMVSGKDVTDPVSYSIQVANDNKIGTEEHKNGVLLIVFKDIHKVRIEVGRGLEGALTDIVCGSIIRNEIAPAFKQGNFYGGITTGIESIKKATRGEYKATKKSSKKSMGSFAFIVMIIIFGAFFVVAIIPRRRVIGSGYRDSGGFFWMGGFGSSGSGWGNDGGGNDDWGGFSGGGGSFGGGGASGDW